MTARCWLLVAFLAAAPLLAQDTRPASALHGIERTVGVLVFEGVELLDFAGPVEVFATANGWDKRFRIFTIAAESGPITTRAGTVIVPDKAIADAPPLHILVVPGGEVRALGPTYPLGRFIAAQAPRVEILFSVCNGAFALADAGLLDGLEATTHRAMIPWLRSSAPKAIVRADKRFVDNGHVVMAAGISAGIDGALHLVDRLLGPEMAVTVAGRIEYAWRDAPSESRPAQDGFERARRAWYAGKWKIAAEAYASIVQERPDDVVALARLGTALLFTRQTDAALPHLEKSVSLGSKEPSTLQALGYAYTKVGRTPDAVPLLVRAHEIDPTSPEIMSALGHAYAEVGRHAEAVPLMKRAMKAGVGDSGNFGDIAKSQAAIGDFPGAIESLTQAADESYPSMLDLLNNAAFAPLSNDARFRALRDAASAAASRPAK